MVFHPGSQIGKYVLRRKLGQGGFGHVFAALDASLDRDVALKFLRAEHTASPEIVRRFLQEARSAAKIVHPGIVTVFECSQVAGTNTAADGTAYIAMELLEGETLTDRLGRGGRMPPAIVIEIGRQLASALEAAHRAGIVHRDLKPDNIFLVADAAVYGGERVKVLDFGIAKLAGPAGRGSGWSAGTSGQCPVAPTLQTQSAIVFGTPRYMSPEQCRSAAAVDHRSDIYTLGCILFEMATGRLPFEGESGELIAQHILVEPPAVRAFAPDIPPALAELIGQMLRKEVDARPTTMAAVQRALEHAGGVAHGVAPTQPPDQGDIATVLPGDTLPQMQTFGIAPRAPKSTTLSSIAAESVPHPRVPPPSELRTKLAVFGGAAAIVLAIPIVAYLALRGDASPADPAIAAATPPVVTHRPEPVATPVDKPVDKPVDPPAPVRDDAPDKPSAPKSKRKQAAATPPASTPARSTLTLTSKPPCEIVIDGKSTGLRTPQLDLALPAGKHKITLVDSAHAIRDSFHVELEPGEGETVSRDYSDRLRKSDPKPAPTRDDETINPFARGGS